MGKRANCSLPARAIIQESGLQLAGDLRKERGVRKRKDCSQDGCKNQVVQGGVCIKHGATVKRCSQDKCKNQSYKAESVSSMG